MLDKVQAMKATVSESHDPVLSCMEAGVPNVFECKDIS